MFLSSSQLLSPCLVEFSKSNPNSQPLNPISSLTVSKALRQAVKVSFLHFYSIWKKSSHRWTSSAEDHSKNFFQVNGKTNFHLSRHFLVMLHQEGHSSHKGNISTFDFTIRHECYLSALPSPIVSKLCEQIRFLTKGLPTNPYGCCNYCTFTRI